jgi:serine/threonine protein kinase
MVLLDLRPFGVNHELDSKKDLPTFTPPQLSTGSYNASAGRFTIDGRVYTVIEKLGEGTYGAAYKTSAPDGRNYAIKRIKGSIHTVSDFNIFMREALIQIILARESEAEANGPYVPKIYKLAFDSAKREAYILCELMRNTMLNLITALDAASNDIVIPDALQQISHILDFFGSRFQFNHRDLKGDNIMYVKTPSNKRIFVLIDFGFSCIDWHGLKINGGSYFARSKTCFREHRDLAQLTYYILKYTPTLSPRLKEWLNDLLEAQVKKTKCSMATDCVIRGKKLIKSWANTYNILDRKNVVVKYANPKNYTRKMQHFIEGKPFVSPLPIVPDPAHICSPGKVWRDGRCVPAGDDAPLVVPDCPPDKIRNQRTRKCVKRDGAIGRALLRAAAPPVAAALPPPAAAALPPPAAAVPPPPPPAAACPPGKIRNPATGRCVLITGAIGRRIAAA